MPRPKTVRTTPVADLITSWRRIYGITQAQLAEATDGTVHETRISRIENGGNPHPETLREIAKGFARIIGDDMEWETLYNELQIARSNKRREIKTVTPEMRELARRLAHYSGRKREFVWKMIFKAVDDAEAFLRWMAGQ